MNILRLHILALLFLFSICIPNKTIAQINLNFDEVLSLGLPVVNVNTIDSVEPTADPIMHPEGSMGQSITNAIKVPGSVTVYSPDGKIMYESGDYVSKESGMTIKIRGNTSTIFDKKPFKIKLQKKGDMLGRGDKKFNDKNWVLLRPSNLKPYLGYEVSKMVGQTWTPAYTFVNVIMNGDYRGLYILQESVERNEKCRINVSDDGFVMEHDPYWWNEDGQYLESEYNPSYNYTFKYPDYEDATEEQLLAIHEALKNYEASIDEGTYPDYIDVESFVIWVMGHDILGNSDGGGVNWFLTKNSLSDDSPIQCGPLWDFDGIELFTEYFSAVHNQRFKRFFENKNPVFNRTYINIWNDNREKYRNALDSIIEDLKEPHWDAYNASAIKDRQRWSVREQTTSDVYTRTKKFYPNRLEWLDVNIAAMEPDVVKREVATLGFPFISVKIEDRENLSANFISAPDESLIGRAVESCPIKISSIDFYSSDGVITESLSSGNNTIEIHPDATSEEKFQPLKIVLFRDVEDSETPQKQILELLSIHDLKTILNIETADYLFEDFAKDYELVNLIINDSHYGIYVNVNNLQWPEVDASEGGFILKNDHRWWNCGENYLQSHSGFHNYTFVNPMPEEMSPLGFQNLVLTLDIWEDNLGKLNDDITDMESFAKWMLLQDILGTGIETDRYVYAFDSSSSVKCLPYINACSSESTRNQWSYCHSLLWNDDISQLLTSQNDDASDAETKFTEHYINAWDDYSAGLFSLINSNIQSFRELYGDNYDKSYKSAYLANSSDSEETLQLESHLTEEIAERATEWYADRYEWMSNIINKYKGVISQIKTIENDRGFQILGNTLIGKRDHESITITGVDGRVLLRCRMSSGESLDLPSGCWILSNGTKSYKIVI